MKSIKAVAVSLLLLLILPLNAFAATVKPKATQKPVEVNSFEMFWPIVAGKVEGDSLYGLKAYKEKVRGFLIFSNLKKAEYNALLSEKRLLEYEKLVIEKKDYENSKKALNSLKQTQESTISLLKKAKEEGMDVSVTSQNILSIFEKENTLLQSLLTKVEESQKTAVAEAIKNLATLSSSIQ